MMVPCLRLSWETFTFLRQPHGNICTFAAAAGTLGALVKLHTPGFGSATSQTVTCWFLFAWLITLVDKFIVVRMGFSSVSLEGFTDAAAWVTASTTVPVALQEGMARGSCVGMQGQGCSQLSQLDVRTAKQRAHRTRLKEQWEASQEKVAIGNTARRPGNPISSRLRSFAVRRRA